MLDPKRIVTAGYDQIAERHAAWAAGVRAQERARYTGLLLRVQTDSLALASS